MYEVAEKMKGDIIMKKLEISGGSASKNSVELYLRRKYTGVKAIQRDDGRVDTEEVSVAETLKNMHTLVRILIVFGFLREIVIVLNLPKFLYHIPTALFILILLMALLVVSVGETRQYHGAEHKVANWFKKDREKMEHEDIKKCSRIHMKCGTNLISTIVTFYLISSIYFSITGNQIPEIFTARLPWFLYSVFPFNILGLLAQLISTKEPDDKHLKVAAVALITLISKYKEE